MNGALEARAGVRRANAVGHRLKFDMHPRAGPPPGQDDAVQQGRARDTAGSPLFVSPVPPRMSAVKECFPLRTS